MACILLLETATKSCSVALERDGKLISLRENASENYSHAEKVTLFIEAVMKESGIAFSKLDAVAVSKGPGSYTGLRIGVSTSKGICYAIEKPLIAVNTLLSMATQMKMRLGKNFSDSDLLCPMIDARRMEVYTAVFDASLREINKTKALIIDENSFSDLTEKHRIHCFGSGAEKCTSVFSNNKQLLIHQDFNLSATGMIAWAERAFLEQTFENLAYFEPFYLKDFVAGTPNVKGLK
ncbi:MAG: tRNA (adenosine(37)-N6)-threonylcarbamoyltransferase complex dimerization subunit type 1 TsaB [Lentimicrobiaceae bacterium]|jgi:tRNA threonylcarbamoyladenosine biosynthesis protein TsaB|nr:tRNA (adenosine(37)-N6)-threonylcarbamoyltransferase complex dimerization subunit type 1 TsaB [Lentimicrobiaceae bacterium]